MSLPANFEAHSLQNNFVVFFHLGVEDKNGQAVVFFSGAFTKIIILNWPANIDSNPWLNNNYSTSAMHQIKRTTNLLQPATRHAQCNPLTACSFVRKDSLGKLEKGEAGEIDWVSLLFYTCRLFLSQICEIFILSWRRILKIKMYQWLWRFLTIFSVKSSKHCSGELWELPMVVLALSK